MNNAMIKHFDKYVAEKNIKLLPWQRLAAYAFLANVDRDKYAIGAGKTFLFQLLEKFMHHEYEGSE